MKSKLFIDCTDEMWSPAKLKLLLSPRPQHRPMSTSVCNVSGESGPVYSKRDLYERGHVAVCSHRQATCITVFVFSSIFLSSLVIAFARPWNGKYLK